MKFSVVIPTFNRIDILPETLKAVEALKSVPFDLVIVNDGSNDGTAEFLENRTFEVPCQIIHQDNSGPSRARNRGVEAASGDIVAILGDDTVPQSDWLSRHKEAHALRDYDSNLAVIGYTKWHRRMRLNPFLEYINEWGLQFGYALIDDPESVPFNFFYTSNLSLHRSLLLTEPFDETFYYTAWEDIEAGYRMSQRGMRLVYEKRARVDHDHPTTFQRFASRQEKAGYNAVIFYKLHPELRQFVGLLPEGPPEPPSALRVHALTRFLNLVQPLPLKLPQMWEDVLRYHYVRGLRRGWRELHMDTS